MPNRLTESFEEARPAKRIPRHVQFKESVVIGTLLCSFPDPLPLFCSKLLHHAPDSFDDKRLGIVAAVIRQLSEARTPVGTLTVIEALGDDRLKTIGGILFVCSLESAATLVPIAEYEAEDIWADYRSRRTASTLDDASQALKSHPEAEPSIVQTVRSSLDALDREHTNGHFELLDSTAFLSQDLPKPTQIVEGILHQGSKLVLGGGSKSFKTWTLLDLAVSVSHSHPWLGFDTRPGPVLYVNFEIQPWSWQDRIKSVAGAKAIELQPNCLSLLNLRGKGADFRLLLPKIKQAAGTRFSLIILDPIYKLYGDTDENSAGAVALLLNAIEDLCVCTGAACAFGAHYSKGNQAAKEAIDRISGSGVFARDPDSILSFTKHEESDAFTVEPTLRNFAPVTPFVVRWFHPLMSRDEKLDPDKLKRPKTGRPCQPPGDLLKLLTDKGLSSKDWLSTAADEGISRATFFRLKSILEHEKRVQFSKVSLTWVPTL